jgi:hypothetical protein
VVSYKACHALRMFLIYCASPYTPSPPMLLHGTALQSIVHVLKKSLAFTNYAFDSFWRPYQHPVQGYTISVHFNPLDFLWNVSVRLIFILQLFSYIGYDCNTIGYCLWLCVVHDWVRYQWGRVMAQAVSLRPLTAEAWVRARVIMSDLWCTKWRFVQVFLRVPRFSPASVIPPWLSILLHHLGDEQ